MPSAHYQRKCANPRPEGLATNLPVPVLARAVALLELLRMQRSRGRSSWVFPRRRGDGPLNRRQVLHALQAACERAHVPATVVHALRHHFATVGVQLDLPTTPMSLALGHSTEWQTTEYQHARRDDVRRAVAKVAGHVAAQLSGKAGAR